jgi:hypothetical protein
VSLNFAEDSSWNEEEEEEEVGADCFVDGEDFLLSTDVLETFLDVFLGVFDVRIKFLLDICWTLVVRVLITVLGFVEEEEAFFFFIMKEK